MQPEDISIVFDEASGINCVRVSGEMNRFPHDADLIVSAARAGGAFTLSECDCCGNLAELIVVMLKRQTSFITVACTDLGVRQFVADCIGISYRTKFTPGRTSTHRRFAGGLHH